MSRLKNLESIFDKVILRIPDYQRGYSWDTKHLNYLWNDLKNINPNSYHFTGFITFEAPKFETIERWTKEFITDEQFKINVNEEVYYPYFIVDGQQRLVSLVILISLLVSSLENRTTEEKVLLLEKYVSKSTANGITYLFGYEKDTPSHQYLIGKIFDDNTMQVTEPETIYTYNLSKAKSYFLEKIFFLNHDQRERLLKKVTNNLLFNVFEIDSEQVDMSLVFETLNFRGKLLSSLEIFKNRLIFLISKRFTFNKANELRAKIIVTWQDIYEWLGKNPKMTLKDDDFLKAFWILFFDHDEAKDDDFNKWETDIFENKYRIMEIRENDYLTEPNIVHLLSCLSKAIKFWFFIHNPKTGEDGFEYNHRVKKTLEKLQRHRYGEFMKPLIITYFLKNLQISQLVSVLEAIERHNFCVYLLFGKQADTNRPGFLRLANKFLRQINAVTHETVVSELRNKTVDHANYQNIFNHIHRNRANNQKFYDWNGHKYVLWEYEEFLRNGRNPLIREFSSANIELIFPDEKNSKLRNDISFAGVKKQRDIDSINKLSHSLGNITITQSNRKAQPYPEYRRKLSEGSYCDRSLANDFQHWNDEVILKRGLTLLNFIESHWGIPIGTDQEKKRLLLDGVQV